MRKIKYVGHYVMAEEDKQNRYYSPAAVGKMEYICSSLNRTGRHVEIISASFTQNSRGCRGRKELLSEHVSLILFASVGTGNLIKRIFRSFFTQFQLGIYLLWSIKRGEPIIVYHSLGYVWLIYFLKKIKRFRLILEVEEIYADVTGNERTRKREMRLFKAADAFLFPTELLDEKINTEKKPSVIIYGTYQVEENRNCKFEDGKIHLLYAGTFDPRKGGAQAAVAVAGKLQSNYHVHLLGFGSDENIRNIKELIETVAKNTQATVTYDGLLCGEDYVRFVQSCDVGLSTQMPDASFNDTSFPSKVLSYLANGLQVVSVRIKALERSAISDLLYYYDENDPEAIAEAVQKIDFSQPYDSRTVIHELDKIFVTEIEWLVEGLSYM